MRHADCRAVSKGNRFPEGELLRPIGIEAAGSEEGVSPRRRRPPPPRQTRPGRDRALRAAAQTRGSPDPRVWNPVQPPPSRQRVRGPATAEKRRPADRLRMPAPRYRTPCDRSVEGRDPYPPAGGRRPPPARRRGPCPTTQVNTGVPLAQSSPAYSTARRRIDTASPGTSANPAAASPTPSPRTSG